MQRAELTVSFYLYFNPLNVRIQNYDTAQDIHGAKLAEPTEQDPVYAKSIEVKILFT